jgi:hypothetical protein
MVCSTLNYFCFTANLPSWSAKFCWNLAFEVVQKNRGVSLGDGKILPDQAHDHLLDDWTHPRAYLAVARANYARGDAMISSRIASRPRVIVQFG